MFHSINNEINYFLILINTAIFYKLPYFLKLKGNRVRLGSFKLILTKQICYLVVFKLQLQIAAQLILVVNIFSAIYYQQALIVFRLSKLMYAACAVNTIIENVVNQCITVYNSNNYNIYIIYIYN